MTGRAITPTMGLAAALGVAMLACTPGTAAAQMPDTFTNLQVLPQDITQERLVGLMKGATQALGVRCDYCHVNTGDTFADFDFPADDKEHKAIARTMIRMTMAINAELLPAPMHAEAGEQRVTCNTCHRGATTPER